MRKFYRQGADEPCFDLTPATEKAIVWLASLTERSFVGTESRLLTLFELLRQMSTGTEADPEVRIEELRRRRDEIDAEIERVRSGDLPLLDDTALKDRFQQFMQMAQELLADFREVEQNFRSLDRRTREHIALWEGSKGELLEGIMTERDVIEDSDQGRSFRAFWDFLMSSARQEELTRLLEHVLALDAVAGMNPPARTRRVHYDWLKACEHTQRTVAGSPRSSGASSTIGCGWRIAASWTSCTASKPRPWSCGSHRLAMRSCISPVPWRTSACPWSGLSTGRPSNH